jgi:hypothetical protein
MYAPETAQQADFGQQGVGTHLVDQQFEEISNARTATLNREMIRMREEGWNVRLDGDHLVASLRAAGPSQLERVLIGGLAMLAMAYVATIVAADLVASLPLSKPAFLGAATGVGVLLAAITRRHASSDRNVTVSIDGQGRPFMADQSGRDF